MRNLWIYPQSRKRLTLASDATDSPARFQSSIDDDLQSEYFSSHDYLDTSTLSIAAQDNFLQTDFRSKGKETTYCTWFESEGIEKNSKRSKEFATFQTVHSIQTSHLATVTFNDQLDDFQSSCEIRKTNRRSANIENRDGSNNVVWIARDISYLRAGSTISIFSPKSRRPTGYIRPNCGPTVENSSFRLVFLCRQGRPR